MPRSKSTRLPVARSISELVRFFDSHDMAEYWDRLPEADFEINLKGRRHLVAIDEEIVPELNRIAKSKKLPSQKLINDWLREKMETSRRAQK